MTCYQGKLCWLLSAFLENWGSDETATVAILCTAVDDTGGIEEALGQIRWKSCTSLCVHFLQYYQRTVTSRLRWMAVAIVTACEGGRWTVVVCKMP